MAQLNVALLHELVELASPYSTHLSVAAAIVVTSVVLSKIIPYLPYFKYDHVRDVKSTVTGFESDYVKEKNLSEDARRDKYTSTTETFYNLITDFYEYGWGQSFHFAPRYKDESFEASIVRYEHYVAANLGLPSPYNALPDDEPLRVLDVGCGIGGPMRSVAKFFKYKVRITGVNITAEHIVRAQRINAKQGIQNCDFIRADFNNIPVPDDTFDAIYDFEATLHSTDTVTTFKELFRVLKPGGRIVTAQYCLKKNYDANNARHVDIIRRVDNTNGCYVAGRTVPVTTANLKKAGFRIISAEDVFTKEAASDIKFSEVFESTRSQRFTGTTFGLWLTYAFCFIGESLFLMPRGTSAVQKMLMGAANSFKEAGREDIITPGYLFVLEKPKSGRPASPGRSTSPRRQARA